MKSLKSFFIPGRVPGLNEILKLRNNYKAYNRVKKELSEKIGLCILENIGRVRYERIHIIFRWIEKDRRRDKDNIAAGKKFILDAMQDFGIIENDGWKQIRGFEDQFEVDKIRPGVRVYIFPWGE